jgi:phosphoenolpyruvate carboxykinase (ATP)
MYHFLSGYTAKVAGTEAGLKEPEATFSTCFGSPFLALHPTRYAQMLREKIEEHNSRVWLVNTGWIGGGPGQVPRMKLAYTRSLLTAALNRSLDEVAYTRDPIFGVEVPESCPGVPSEILKPENQWADKAAYRTKANELAGLFRKNFEQFASEASQGVRAAEPVVS